MPSNSLTSFLTLENFFPCRRRWRFSSTVRCRFEWLACTTSDSGKKLRAKARYQKSLFQRRGACHKFKAVSSIHRIFLLKACAFADGAEASLSAARRYWGVDAARFLVSQPGLDPLGPPTVHSQYYTSQVVCAFVSISSLFLSSNLCFL